MFWNIENWHWYCQYCSYAEIACLAGLGLSLLCAFAIANLSIPQPLSGENSSTEQYHAIESIEFQKVRLTMYPWDSINICGSFPTTTLLSLSNNFEVITSLDWFLLLQIPRKTEKIGCQVSLRVKAKWIVVGET